MIIIIERLSIGIFALDLGHAIINVKVKAMHISVANISEPWAHFISSLVSL